MSQILRKELPELKGWEDAKQSSKGKEGQFINP
jgi:hypothetical protein